MQRVISQLPSRSHTIFDPRNRNRYITHLQYTVLSPEDRAGVLIYPTMFYVSLSNKKLERRVARWTKEVDIFSKNILVFPINTGSQPLVSDSGDQARTGQTSSYIQLNLF